MVYHHHTASCLLETMHCMNAALAFPALEPSGHYVTLRPCSQERKRNLATAAFDVSGGADAMRNARIEDIRLLMNL